MSQSSKVRVGVIGAGGIARNMHLPSLSEMPNVELAAVCDLIEERAVEKAKQYSIPGVYTLFREMLAKEKLDAVFVLVEPSSLFHVVRECLKAGLPVFMEKPPGITSYQCASLARAAKEAGRILQVGFNRRYIPLVRKVMDMLREATTITQIEGRFMKQGKAAFDQGGLAALASDVIHAIDLVRWIAGGEPAAAATVASQHNDVVINAWNSVVRFDNGVAATIRSNYQTGARFHSFEIHGPGASAFINLGFGGQSCDAKVVFGKGAGGYSISARGAGAFQCHELDGKQLAGSDKYYRYYGYYQEDVHFIDCVLNGQTPLTDIEDAVKTYAMVDMIEQRTI